MAAAARVVADASVASALLRHRPGRSPRSKNRAKSAKLALGMAFGLAIVPTEREATRIGGAKVHSGRPLMNVTSMAFYGLT